MNSWMAVEEVLIFQEENKKKGLAVQLNYLFGRLKDGSIPVSVVEDPLGIATAVATKKLNTATNKSQKEMEERVILQGQTTDRMRSLQAMHVCDKELSQPR